MTDAREVEVEVDAGRVHRPWRALEVIAALAVLIAVAGFIVVGLTGDPDYVGKTEPATLVGDSCNNVLELYRPVPSGPMRAGGGELWLNRPTDDPAELLERANGADRATSPGPTTYTSTLSGRVHFTSATTATFTSGVGFQISLVRRTLRIDGPTMHSCAIFGPN